MRRVIFLVLITSLATAIIASTRSVPTLANSGNVAKLEQELKNADLDFAKQTAARGLDGWMDFFAEDASTISSGRMISGKEALHKYYAAVFANKDFTLTWKPVRAEASRDGTLGYTYGDYEAKEDVSISHGMYATVWRRDNGYWKVVLDMGSSTPAAAKSQGQN
ncbi:MAG TPA: nuclear transport factor 2 family protein [Candidatus Angelobacter sp.]|jgi:ketosteroid isomerase-like protein